MNHRRPTQLQTPWMLGIPLVLALHAGPPASGPWNPDLGDGRYETPALHADYDGLRFNAPL